MGRGVAVPPFFCMNDLPKKVCKKCELAKYLHEFSRDRKSDDNVRAICKKCMNTQQKEYRRKNNPPLSRDYSYAD